MKFLIVFLVCFSALISFTTSLKEILDPSEIDVSESRRVEASIIESLSPFMSVFTEKLYDPVVQENRLKIVEIIFDAYISLFNKDSAPTDVSAIASLFSEKDEGLLKFFMVDFTNFCEKLRAKNSEIDRKFLPLIHDMKRGYLLYFETLPAQRAFQELFLKFDSLLYVHSENYFMAIHSLFSLSENCFRNWIYGFQAGHGAYELMHTLTTMDFSDAYGYVLWYQHYIYKLLAKCIPVLELLEGKSYISEPFSRFFTDNAVLFKRCKCESEILDNIYKCKNIRTFMDTYERTVYFAVEKAFYYTAMHSLCLSQFVGDFLTLAEDCVLPTTQEVMKKYITLLQEEEEENNIHLGRAHEFFYQTRLAFDRYFQPESPQTKDAGKLRQVWALITSWLRLANRERAANEPFKEPFVRSKNVDALKNKLVDSLNIALFLNDKSARRSFVNVKNFIDGYCDAFSVTLSGIFNSCLRGSPGLVMSPTMFETKIWNICFIEARDPREVKTFWDNVSIHLAAFQTCAFHLPNSEAFFAKDMQEVIASLRKHISYSATHKIIEFNLTLFSEAMMKAYFLDKDTAKSFVEINELLLSKSPFSAEHDRVDAFTDGINYLDKQIQIFLYCLNTKAAHVGLEKINFIQVWELDGATFESSREIANYYLIWFLSFRKTYLNDLEKELSAHQLSLLPGNPTQENLEALLGQLNPYDKEYPAMFQLIRIIICRENFCNFLQAHVKDANGLSRNSEFIQRMAGSQTEIGNSAPKVSENSARKFDHKIDALNAAALDKMNKKMKGVTTDAFQALLKNKNMRAHDTRTPQQQLEDAYEMAKKSSAFTKLAFENLEETMKIHVGGEQGQTNKDDNRPHRRQMRDLDKQQCAEAKLRANEEKKQLQEKQAQLIKKAKQPQAQKEKEAEDLALLYAKMEEEKKVAAEAKRQRRLGFQAEKDFLKNQEIYKRTNDYTREIAELLDMPEMPDFDLDNISSAALKSYNEAAAELLNNYMG